MRKIENQAVRAVAEKLVLSLEPVIDEMCRCRKKQDMEQELRLFIIDEMLKTQGKINSKLLILRMGRHLEKLQQKEWDKGWTEVPHNLTAEERAVEFAQLVPDKYRYTERGKVAIVDNHL